MSAGFYLDINHAVRFFGSVAEGANSYDPAVLGMNLSSKRTGQDTYFWIVNNK